MASLLESSNSASIPEKSVTNNYPVKSCTIGVIIDGQHTDILINEYQDRLFIVLSQFKKFGSLVTVFKESAGDGKAGDETGVYVIRTLLGKEDISQDVAARYLAEQTLMKKPALFSICLKNTSFKTLEAIKDIILHNKTW